MLRNLAKIKSLMSCAGNISQKLEVNVFAFNVDGALLALL
jgi:hypothetical protein